jgi:hypothetical protein
MCNWEFIPTPPPGRVHDPWRSPLVSLLAPSLLLIAVCLVHAGAAACDVRVNEFCAGPAATGTRMARSPRVTTRIELVTGLMPVDLSIYMISDADSTIRWAGTPHESR